jgi:hypothetical protein
MRTRVWIIVGVLAACGGPADGEDGASAATGDGETGSDDATTTESETTGDGDGSSGDGDGDSGDGDGDGDGDGSAGDGDGGPGDGDGDGSVTYEAHALIGALDRVVIIRRDALADQCAVARIVMPGGTGSTVSAPNNWGFEFGFIVSGADGCDPWNPTGDPSFNATAASGWVDFPDPGTMIYPCSLDLDVHLTFTGGPMWSPPSLQLVADDVAVIGACP